MQLQEAFIPLFPYVNRPESAKDTRERDVQLRVREIDPQTSPCTLGESDEMMR